MSRRQLRLLLSSLPLVTLVVLFALLSGPFPFGFAFPLVAVVLLFAFPLVALCSSAFVFAILLVAVAFLFAFPLVTLCPLLV